MGWILVWFCQRCWAWPRLVRRHTAAALLDLTPSGAVVAPAAALLELAASANCSLMRLAACSPTTSLPAVAAPVLILGAVPPSRGRAPSGLVLGSPFAELCNRGTLDEAMRVEVGLRMSCPQVALEEALDWVRGLGLFVLPWVQPRPPVFSQADPKPRPADWISNLAKGGAKKNIQYCVNPNSSNQFLYLRAIQGHSGDNSVDPTLQDCYRNDLPSASTTSGTQVT